MFLFWFVTPRRRLPSIALVAGVALIVLYWPAQFAGATTAAQLGAVGAQNVASDALARDRLRSQQAKTIPQRASARPATSSGSATSNAVAAAASGPVPGDLVGLDIADNSIGPGSTLQLAQQSGAGWILGWISWQNLEPTEGQFAWTQGTGNDIDNLIRAGQWANMRVLAKLQNVPAWATTDGSGNLAAVRPAALQAFVQALAAHAAGRVAAYEIFNEPNLNYEWGKTLDASGPVGYASLLRAAYAGIKAGDGSAVVVSAGLADGAGGQSMDDQQYLSALYAAGARGGVAFDAVGTHRYGGSYPPEQDPSCGGTCLRHAELQRQIMVKNGDSATPMWATEVGWLLDSTYDLGPYFNWMKVSAQQQADYLSGAMQYAHANWPWMQHMFVFNLDHSTAMWCGGACYPPTTSVYWFSILNPDRTPRLAYTELSNLLHGITPTPTPSPTSTSTPTVTPSVTPSPTVTPSVTPTSTSTPTVTPGDTQTITFDALPDPNRPLTGQYPSGVIDWGSGAWYVSGPWGQFNGNSIGFNDPSYTTASFSFVSPARLIALDAYNGGTSDSTITLSCAGQPTVQQSVAANQLTTIATGWSVTCGAVTVGSSNGSNTNFDNLVLQ